MNTETTMPETEVEPVETPETEEPEASDIAAASEPEDTEEIEASEEEGAEEEATEEGEDTEAEEIELKVGGEVLKVPKEAMPDEIRERVQGFLNSAESSYTRKFQDVAEQKKTIEARQQELDVMEGLQGEVLDSYSRGLSLRAEIEQLQGVDLNALWQSNPDQARRVSDQLQRKQAEFQRTVNEVAEQERKLGETRQQAQARQFEEGKAQILSQVPDFEQRLPEVIDYASKTYGVDPKEAESAWALNPMAATALYKAMLYDRMQGAKKAKPAKPAPAKPVKSAAKGGSAKPAPDISKMSMDEYAAYMNRRDGIPNR